MRVHCRRRLACSSADSKIFHQWAAARACLNWQTDRQLVDWWTDNQLKMQPRAQWVGNDLAKTVDCLFVDCLLLHPHKASERCLAWSQRRHNQVDPRATWNNVMLWASLVPKSGNSCNKTHRRYLRLTWHLLLTLYSSNFNTNSKISASCLTSACCVSRCCVGFSLPPTSWPNSFGTILSSSRECS